MMDADNFIDNSPKIEIIEITTDRIKFVLSGCDLSMANALRRVMISEVPTIAIEDVTVKINSSPLSDEFISHRLGLVPLTSERIQQFNFPWMCTCFYGCNECRADFKLNIVNKNDSNLDVTTQHIKSVGDHDITPVDVVKNDRDEDEQKNHILLARLGKNQELDIDCRAVKGFGKDHAKFCPVAVATFQHDPKIEFDDMMLDRLVEEEKRSIHLSCPTGVYSYDSQVRELQVEDARKCTFCMECTKKAEEIGYRDLISIGRNPDCFIFSVETTGSLTPRQIVDTAFRVLQEKLEAIEANLN